MRRPSARTVKTIGMTGGTGGMVAAALAAGWVGAALLIIAILAPTIAISWTRSAANATSAPCTTTPPRRATTTTKPRRAISEPPAAG